MFERRGHDVLGQTVQSVRQLPTPGWPPRGEPIVGPPIHQHGLGAQGLIERELGELWTVLDQADPTAAREAFVTRRVLDDSVERDVVAYDDLPHFAVLRLRYSLTTRRCSSQRLTDFGYVGGGALLTYKP